VSEKNNQILFSQGETSLVGRLIEAEYPNYEKIIPTEFNTKTEVAREALQNAIKICSVFARETANIIKFSIDKNKIIVSANSPSVGEDTVEIEAKTSGEENEIAFNAKYLLDVLAAVNEENLIFEMTGPLNPGVFKIKGNDSFLHLIMPIRVQG
jgi:DNA polymerase-3 subunit beta